MVRYLTFVSYFGPGYWGLQTQTNRPLKTVGSVLKEALSTVNANIAPHEDRSNDRFVFSSRTDKGVHALCNAGHIDFHSPSYESLNPDVFTKEMNIALQSLGEKIRLMKTIRIPDDFHARRHAIGRSYVYRICILNDPLYQEYQATPLFDEQRCMIIRTPVDMNLVAEAGKILSGTNDFRAFTTSRRRQLVETDVNPAFRIKSIKDMEVKLLEEKHFTCNDVVSRFYKGSNQYWNILFKSNSFLYRQVRKMVAAMIAVGCRQLSLKDLESLLDESTMYTLGQSTPETPTPLLNPEPVATVASTAPYSKSSGYHRKISPVDFGIRVPSGGLYLANVEYPKEILEGRSSCTFESSSENDHDDCDDDGDDDV